MSLLNPAEAAGHNCFHIKASFNPPDQPKFKRDKDGIPIDPNYEMDYRFIDSTRLKRTQGQTGYNTTPRGIGEEDEKGVAPILKKKK